MSNLAIVRAFIAAWERRDVDAIVAAFAPDGVYINVGWSESRGREAIRATVAPLLSSLETVSWTVRHEAETAAGVVLNERTDVFVMRPEAGGRTIVADVMGVFELEDGLIARWRDYFDVEAFKAQMGWG